MSARRDLLAATPLFARMPPAALDGLASAAAQRRYRKGQLIIRQGDPGHSLHIVAEGLVKVVVTSRDGEELILATLGRADTFGELSVIDGGAASASVEAVAPTTALSLTRATLLDLLARQPGVADVLLRSLGAVIRRLTDQTGDLVFLDLQARVAKLLVTLADAREQTAEGEVELDLKLTQSELGAMVGGSRQSVNQILQDLERRGFVRRRGRDVIVKDLAALRRRAGAPD